MKKQLALILFLVVAIGMGATNHNPNTWINEIHYDNDGGDVGEAVEIVVENADQFDLSLLRLDLYNGSSGEVYKSYTLKDSVPCGQEGNFSFYVLNISGIQNGAPDGFALSYEEHLLQFISYEGECEATDGVANGITSVDIGVEEGSSTEIGQSLQLAGNGTTYADFTWQEPAAETYCGLNAGQTFGVETVAEKVKMTPVVWLGPDKMLNLRVKAVQYVKVYDISGRLVYASRLKAGTNSIKLKQQGIYIVKTDDWVQKVMLR